MRLAEILRAVVERHGEGNEANTSLKFEETKKFESMLRNVQKPRRETENCNSIVFVLKNYVRCLNNLRWTNKYSILAYCS